MMISQASFVPPPTVPSSVGTAAQPTAAAGARPAAVIPENQTVIATAKSPSVKADNSPLLSLSNEVFSALHEDRNHNPAIEGAEHMPEEPAENKNPVSSKIETTDPSGLTEAEQEQVETLERRDREVRNHEQAHAAAGGQYAGSPSYEYQTGPDNQRYAVGGEVKIDTAPIAGDPAATITKMDVVIRAALAPAEPSGQDKAVAAAASQRRAEAQAELSAQRQAELSGNLEEATKSVNTGPSGAPVSERERPKSTVDPSAITDLFA
ncbi:putative metalloprotease CJM1_0395 family protein [Sneathiella aquimaris]|uniref:putative metalloprotease CJM1_0395 family protein n=1 Tax=Sneathiella aquimaris TaxID=2599305 RepID=UPI001CA4B537|nr:putative metalloprotease CJM1_0395 family protein [Sneathiella aquimaris]